MTIFFRVLRLHIPSVRPTCLSTNQWRVGDSKYYSSRGPKISDEEQDKLAQKNKIKERKEEAALKLNKLLESIAKHPSGATAADPSSDSGVSGRLARPGARPRPRDVVPSKKRAAAVASAAPAPARPGRQPTLDEQVAAAAREVASSLSGDPAQTEHDLLSKLSEESEQPAGSQTQLSELMSSMKVEQRPSRAQQVRRQVGTERADTLRQARRDRPAAAPRAPRTAADAALDDVDLHRGETLGIFTDMKPADAATELEPAPADGVWERLHARELRLCVAHPPANAWEEMAGWTEQGKLWHLPVDNEQGLDQEAAVPFHEHVFLEGRLEPWCPPRGPVRNFMELVCIALGKNPWLSVQEKHEHIDWFREYFAGKQALLQELKAV